MPKGAITDRPYLPYPVGDVLEGFLQQGLTPDLLLHNDFSPLSLPDTPSTASCCLARYRLNNFGIHSVLDSNLISTTSMVAGICHLLTVHKLI
jgi:hypothetical protein